MTIGLVASVVLALFLALTPQTASANSGIAGYGGPGFDKVDVCRQTASRFMPFMPYVLISIPEFVAKGLVARGVAIWPDLDDTCPSGDSVRGFVEDRVNQALQRAMERIADRGGR